MELNIPLYQVDAFAREPFAGNPAAVCPLDHWLEDRLLQAIAAENNLSETAFFVRRGERFELRWFAPAAEVDLCGHATLATAHVLFRHLGFASDRVRFETKSGELVVEKRGDLLALDFPSRPAAACEAPEELLTALGARPVEVLRSRDYLAVFRSEDEVLGLRPDMAQLARLPVLGVIATAAGRSHDFVSRFFAPSVGVPEDPVTGSSHCTLVPYWARRLGKTSLHARQASRRGGELWCEDRGDRVSIAGFAVTYLEGTIRVPVP
ncbi:MAG: PhzF family phenazine biosynthesis protein [Deltaproteobacteria bacterium]|nr:PhzF family phenazine biosynthesis protein [Deltaproteobacteria bacterium]